MSGTVAYSGVLGTVLSGTTDMDVKSFTATVSAANWDKSTTADAGWTNAGGGLKSVKGSFDCFYNKAKKPFGAVPNLTPGTDPGPTLTLTCATGDTLTGVAIIDEVSIKSETKDGIMFTCTFQNQGAWVLPT